MISVRHATHADIPAMEALIKRSGIELSEGFYTSEQAQAVTRYVFGVDTQLVADQTISSSKDGQMACGGWSKRSTLFGADRTKQGADPLLDPAREPARIRAFFVDPSVARQGLGRLLLQHCTDAAAAGGFHTLELAATMLACRLHGLRFRSGRAHGTGFAGPGKSPAGKNAQVHQGSVTP
jgi:ribosomal protein S18 acetylase RimI-like enzyme